MRAVLVLAVAALVACVAAAAQPQPRIVFAADRATTRDGEIYSFDLATGVTRDLSRSLAYDSSPSVSPDGKWIAFGSMRSGAPAVYVMRIDGSDVRLVKRFRAGYAGVGATWSPDGAHIAATSCCTSRGELWIGTVDGVGTTLWNAAGYDGAAWSRDGRFYAYVAHDFASDQVTTLDVVDVQGRRISQRDTDGARDFGWSADGRLAWMTGATAHVGKETFRAQNIAWSPDGRTLAVTHIHSIELRRGGERRTVYRTRGSLLSAGWLGSHHLVFLPSNKDAYVRLDVRTGKTATASYADIFGTVSPDERLRVAPYDSRGYRSRQLRVGPLLGGPTRVIASTRFCPDDHAEPFGAPSFVPGTKIIVYFAGCDDPTHDLYSANPDGTGLRQLTFTREDEEGATLSPNGDQIAYIRRDSIGHGCEGCAAELWVMNADGTHARRLTNPAIQNEIGAWDANPSWSPDGKSLMFDRSNANGNWHLWTVNADGGAATKLSIPGARQPKWGPKRIAYSGNLGAIWTALPDGTHRVQVAPRHTCDSDCYYAWTSKGLVYATVKSYVTHSTIWIRGAERRKIQLPFRPAMVDWQNGQLLVTPPARGYTGQWSEGDLYRVEANGSLTRLTTALGSISLD